MKELLLKNAADKLRREMSSKDANKPATMIQEKVAEALDEFCRQETKLAEAIINSTKTFAQCCEEILKDTKTERYISDLKAYSRAVEFYLDGAQVSYTMSIKLNGGNDISNISFEDLLGV